LQQAHEAALKAAIDSKEQSFDRERDAIRRAAARERVALTREAQRVEERAVALEQTLQAERDARARDAAEYEAARAAEVAAMQHAVVVEGELELHATALLQLQQQAAKQRAHTPDRGEGTPKAAAARVAEHKAASVQAGDGDCTPKAIATEAEAAGQAGDASPIAGAAAGATVMQDAKVDDCAAAMRRVLPCMPLAQVPHSLQSAESDRERVREKTALHATGTACNGVYAYRASSSS